MRTRTRVPTVSEFYLDRLAEVEKDARLRGELGHLSRDEEARVLAECQAHRNIVDMLLVLERPAGLRGRVVLPSLRVAMDLAVRQLAAVYSDHEDYQEEWRP